MLQLKIEQCRRDEAEPLCDMLEESGALSITMTDQHDDPILEPELGTSPLWPQVVIHALYEEKEEAERVMQALSSLHSHLDFALEPLPEKDWQRVCMDDFKPLRFGKRLWICPSWLTPPDPDAVNLILDPGLAFGTGTHPTTSLCLTWLEQAKLEQQQVIDYGCGSGILALAALKLGAKHVHGVDIDTQALLATQNNATENHITATQLTVGLPDTAQNPVDLVIANILLSPLLTLKSRFRQLLNDNGTLVVSGLLAEQAESLIDRYQGVFMHETTMIEDGWALLVFKCS